MHEVHEIGGSGGLVIVECSSDGGDGEATGVQRAEPGLESRRGSRMRLDPDVLDLTVVRGQRSSQRGVDAAVADTDANHPQRSGTT